jgi:hypothetical protein
MNDNHMTEPKVSKVKALKRLGVFQLKLALDALRDVLLSPMSVVCTLMDIIEGNTGKNSYFEKLLRFGRRTERKINLFQQQDTEQGSEKNIDTLVEQVETILARAYTEGQISTKAKSTIDKMLQRLRARHTQTSQSESTTEPSQD